jgi:hypothetical protein
VHIRNKQFCILACPSVTFHYPLEKFSDIIVLFRQTVTYLHIWGMFGDLQYSLLITQCRLGVVYTLPLSALHRVYHNMLCAVA